MTDSARASTRPQSELLRSLMALVLALSLGGLVGLALGWQQGLVAAGLSALLGLALLVWRERRLLRRLASGAEAMAALDLPLLILDAQDRVHWASAAYSRLYAGLGQVPVGLPYAELKRRVLATDTLALTEAEREPWLQARLADHAAASHVRLQLMRDGRWWQVVERRTLLGGWTSVAFDVTELLQAQQQAVEANRSAQHANALLEDALDAMPAGFEIWDRDDRLVRCNRRLLDLYPGAADLLVPGVQFEAVVQRTLDLRSIPAALGREAQWLSERLAARVRPGRPFLMDYGGRWLQVDERRTRSGHLVCVRQDVTELVDARRALTQAQARAERQHRLLERAVEALPVAVEIYDAEDRLLLVNHLFRAWHPQVDYDALIGQTYEQAVRLSQERGLLPIEARADPEAWIAARVASHGRDPTPRVNALNDGRMVLTQETRTPEGYVVMTRQDITALRHNEQALEAARGELEALVQTAGAAIITLGGGGLVRSLNLAGQSLWGYTEAEMLGRPAALLLDESSRGPLMADFLALQKGQKAALIGQRRELNARHRDGSLRVIQAAMSEVAKPSETFYVGVITDVTEQRAAEARLREANTRLEHLSATDALTGLANRRRLMETLQQQWQHALRERQAMALLLVDVDHFKRYNDHHGHQAGDAALQAVAQEMAACARRTTDLAARYGGEEFVLLLDHCDEAGALERAEVLRQRLQALALPHGDAPLGRVTVSVGVASQLPERDARVEDLLSRADAALYRAKAAGRDRAAL